MTEKEKMLAGMPYDCSDKELMEIWFRGKNLAKEYNLLDYSDRENQKRILDNLLGSRGKNLQITAPLYVDYGKFIHIGDNCEINMNCTLLDCNIIEIGNNVLIAPNVQIYTAFHPLKASERLPVKKDESEEFPFAITQSAPVKIGDNVWIGGGAIIMPNVVIGDNVTIGAGSVVTKSIPSNVVAYGNPCRVAKNLPA